MNPAPPRQFFIQGQTLDGRAFRPSDWAERLAGAMSCFRPGGAKGGIGSFIGYSPYCVPRLIDNVKNVIVDERLKALEPMAWDFVMNFARDNDLVVVESAAGWVIAGRSCRACGEQKGRRWDAGQGDEHSKGRQIARA